MQVFSISNLIQNDIPLFAKCDRIKHFKLEIVRNTTVSIVADETSDCSHYEHLSICVSYFNKKENHPVEYFMGYRLLSVNAHSVYVSLIESINIIGIDWKM